MSSMIESLMGSLGEDKLGAIMGALGGGSDNAPSPDATKSAIGNGLGAILGGLAGNAAKPGGADALFSAVAKKHDGGVLDDLDGAIGAGDSEDGGKILGHVFGDSRPNVEAKIAESSGLDASMVTKLLPMLAPIVMGWLGKKVASGEVDSASLGSVLQSEKQGAEKAMPDLGGLLGGLFGGGSSAGGGGGGGADAGGDTMQKAGGILNMLKGLFGAKR